MKVIQLTLDERGRIHIPASLRENLNLNPGMTLVVESGEQGGVRLQPQPTPSVLVKKDGVLVARVAALTDLGNVGRNERDRRVFDLLQRTGL